MISLKNTLKLLVSLFLLMVSASQADTSMTYIHTDHLGSPIAATDEAGQVKWTEEYQPFGVQRTNQDSDNSTGFTGHQYDDELELTYMQARWYHPEVGRFMSLDPLLYRDVYSFNRYVYANDNPYKYVDPDGRIPILPIVIFLAKEIASEEIEEATGVPMPTIKNAAKYAAKKVAKDKVKDKVIKDKPDFIVSSKGTVMDPSKDYNLVDANKKGGDWMQIHNKHKDAKVKSNPHTHYPLDNGRSRTRQIKETDGSDLNRADKALKNGIMRERLNRKDKGGEL